MSTITNVVAVQKLRLEMVILMYMERVCTKTVNFVQNENVSISATSDNYGDGDNNGKR
jgi:hypothetical protein